MFSSIFYNGEKTLKGVVLIITAVVITIMDAYNCAFSVQDN